VTFLLLTFLPLIAKVQKIEQVVKMAMSNEKSLSAQLQEGARVIAELQVNGSSSSFVAIMTLEKLRCGNPPGFPHRNLWLTICNT
jgi:hypothetical protein